MPNSEVKLRPEQVGVLLDQIRRSGAPNMEQAADALGRHLSAVGGEATWTGYIERMIQAMTANSGQLAEIREDIRAVAGIRGTVETLTTTVAHLAAEVKALRDARDADVAAKVAQDQAAAAAKAAQDQAAATAKYELEKQRTTAWYEKIAGPIVMAIVALASALASRWLGAGGGGADAP